MSRAINIRVNELFCFEGNDIYNVDMSQAEFNKLVEETVRQAVEKVKVAGGADKAKKMGRRKKNAKASVSSVPKFNPIEAEEQGIVKKYLDSLNMQYTNFQSIPKIHRGATVLYPVEDKSIKKEPKMMVPSQELKEYLKSVEPYQPGIPDLKPYNDSSGNATIGFGHKIHNGKVTKKDLEKYRAYTAKLAERDFENDLLRQGVEAVQKNVKTKLTQNQFDALVDFVYNTGWGNFAKSDLLKSVNKDVTDPQ